MLRWIMLALLVAGGVLTFTAKSVGLLTVGLIFDVVGLFGTIFSLAADRVSASARPDTTMLAAEDLAAMRARRAGTAPRPVPSMPRPAPAAPATKASIEPKHEAQR
jgi:hypothetical protein